MTLRSLFSGKGALVKIMIVVILGIILISVFAQDFIAKNILMRGHDEKDGAMSAGAVKTYTVADKPVDDNREYFGEITYYEKVSVSSKVTGKLEKIYIKEGQIVKPGDAIAQIERLPLELTLKQQNAELDIAKTAYTLAQAKYENALKSMEIKFKTIEKARVDLKDKEVSSRNSDRILKNKEKLFEAGGVSETELKSIQAQQVTSYSKMQLAKADLEIQEVGFRDSDITSAGYKVPKASKEKIEILKKINTKIELAELDSANSRIRQVEANIQSTRILLNETTIRSPFWGVVASKNMDAGELVKADSMIANLININDVYLVINISEKDIIDIKQKQKVLFTVDAQGKKEFDGTIAYITPVLDAKTRTMAVKATVKNPTKALLPGMFARAKIITGNRVNRILIPVSAVIDRKDSRGAVYLIKKNIVFRQEIEIGREFNGMVEISRGVEKGDEIVSENINAVYPGMKIPRQN
jgi:RND family efflux transporter MFP subunit